MTTKRKPNLVLTHDKCVDGFTASWVIWKALGDSADYIPVNYGTPPPAEAVDRDCVILADFSYDRKTMLELARANESIVILDHHHTAEAALVGLADELGPRSHVEFDMERSGAGIAWDHFHRGQKRPWLVDYVEDRDLWRWKLPYSREISGYIRLLPFTFRDWDDLSVTSLVHAVDKGEVALKTTTMYCQAMAPTAARVDIWGFSNVPVVNAPFYDISDLLNFVCDEGSIAIGWQQRADGKFQFSLRGKGDVDVSQIALKYDGGGHKLAAGFIVDEYPAWVYAARRV